MLEGIILNFVFWYMSAKKINIITCKNNHIKVQKTCFQSNLNHHYLIIMPQYIHTC